MDLRKISNAFDKAVNNQICRQAIIGASVIAGAVSLVAIAAIEIGQRQNVEMFNSDKAKQAKKNFAHIALLSSVSLLASLVFTNTFFTPYIIRSRTSNPFLFVGGKFMRLLGF